jgi:hypothetical protein
MEEQLLNLVLASKGRDFILSWLGETPAKPKRGRKPGAAPAESRCAWTSAGAQCKNKKVGEEGYCRIHAPKSYLIDLSGGSSPAS